MSFNNAAYLRQYRQKVRDWVASHKEAHPCLDCGGYFKACQMQFDHLRDKKLNVSLASSLEQAKAEIEKCELVCANCHALRTYNRSQDDRRRTGLTTSDLQTLRDATANRDS